jgi:flagellar basal body-associated protein FliL
MAYSYEFKSDSKVKKESFKKEDFKGGKKSVDKNKTVIIVLIVVAALLFIGISSSVSGYVAYRESVNKQLDSTVQELSTVTKEKEECNTNLFSSLEKETQCKSQLSSKDSQLNTCNNQKTTLEQQKTQSDALYSSCLAQKEDLDEKYTGVVEQLEASSSEYDELAKNSVRSVCCSIGDILSGAVRYWEVSDNKIICAENGRNVNCGTGETDF